MTVVTRFAPSPTGFLHIGGARTALFNWLYAKHTGGKFLLRVEDTDRKRSTPEAVEAILDGIQWLGLDHDDDVVYQFSRADRHKEIAEELLANGHAYKCYCSPEELAEMRETAKAEGRPMGYDGRWRDWDPSDAPAGVDPVIRIKAPESGETVIKDQVQGDVTFQNDQLDDFIILRADGTPTYMLSVVVDDHDMGVTHVIRGDDHLNNAARQSAVYTAMGWDQPVFAHIPLIHGADGAKLSKRHGALGVDAYRDMGYLPEAIRNYLLRLGWSHGDEEVISTEQAIEWFDIGNINKGASRFDFAKLENLNGIYIRQTDNNDLLSAITPALEDIKGSPLVDHNNTHILELMDALKERAKVMPDLVEAAAFLVKSAPLDLDEKAETLLSPENRSMLQDLAARLDALPAWEHDALADAVKDFAKDIGLKMGKVGPPLRAALTGRGVSPSIFEILEIMGKEESLGRIRAVAA